jgi:hypothetical protein
MGISRSAAVCVLLVALGWRYAAASDYRLSMANPLLLQLLLREFGLSDTLGDTIRRGLPAAKKLWAEKTSS